MQHDGGSRVYVVEGVRTPFLRSGTGFADLRSYDLARYAISGLLARTRIDPDLIGRVILGCVVSNLETSNVAREAALAAGIPPRTPAHTVSQACVSANQAITSGSDLIRTGQADLVLAGGTESLSDFPIRFRKALRRRLFESRRYRSVWDYSGFLKGLRPSDFLPEIPSISEFSTGLTMGEDCERLVSRFGVTRREQDEFAVRSHQLAARAAGRGQFEQEIIPVAAAPDFLAITADNGIRPETTVERLASLKPAFAKPYGTLTAGNSSFLTDGAAVVLLASRRALDNYQLVPRAEIIDYYYSGQTPDGELLLGPACATPVLIARNGLKLSDIEVFEFHEAFAGQVLANLACLGSADFAEQHNLPHAVGFIPVDRLNTRGGSLSIGHPFGATGARLVTTAANRLLSENASYALVASCAAGGIGNGILLKAVHMEPLE
jgi:acetyl-CoA acyltransferase